MKLQSIQVLRGLAALLVVVFHIGYLENKIILTAGLDEPRLISGVFTNGYAGVDLFFVISGFIMVYVTRDVSRGLAATADFVVGRITRLYPVWWLFAGILTIYMLITNHATPELISGKEPLVPFIIKSFLLIPQDEQPILGVGWTLIHEVYFYAVFAVLLFLPRKALPFCLGAWALLIIAGQWLGLVQPLATSFLTVAFYPMTMEFILGAFMGLLVLRGPFARADLITVVAALWLTCALCLQGAETAFMLEWGRVLWFGLPCSLLVYGFAALEASRRLVWLVPAATGALVCAAVYQLYGLDAASSETMRHQATAVAGIIGLLAVLAVMWSGWLIGQSRPDVLRGMVPAFRRVMSAFVSLGDWSYSLYLSHMLVFSLLRRIFSTLGEIEPLSPFFQVGHPGILDNLLFVLISLALSLTTASCAYRYFERPAIIFFGKWRRAAFNARSQPAPA